MSGTSQETLRNSLALENSESLKQQQGSLHGKDLRPLHICDSYAAWSTCGTTRNGQGAVPSALTVFWGNPFFMLDCLARSEYRGRFLALGQIDTPWLH